MGAGGPVAYGGAALLSQLRILSLVGLLVPLLGGTPYGYVVQCQTGNGEPAPD